MYIYVYIYICIHIHIHIHIHVSYRNMPCVHMCVYIYIHIERERDIRIEREEADLSGGARTCRGPAAEESAMGSLRGWQNTVEVVLF